MKKKISILLLSLILTMTMIGSQTLGVFAAEETTTEAYASKLEATEAYISQQFKKNPIYGMEWYALYLNRSNYKDAASNAAYYENYGVKVKEKSGVLDTTKYTTYSKGVLALTAIGRDVTDVAGYNLLKKIKDTDSVDNQGLNGPVYALLALNSKPSYIDESNSADKTIIDTYIKFIVGKVKPGGGWAYSNDEKTGADVDMTAITIQSLAPYYGKSGYEKVTDEVNKGLKFLAKHQTASGGFQSWGTENSESTSQVIVALTALGFNPSSSAAITLKGEANEEPVTFNSGKTQDMVSNLLTYFVKGGQFKHIQTGKADGMATTQAYCALVAYDRFVNSKSAIYDMGDITQTADYDMRPIAWGRTTLSTLVYTYSGASKKPIVTIKYGGRTLTEGVDYTLTRPATSYIPGTYNIRITGKGNFTGYRDVYYTINKKNQTLTATKSTWYKIYGNSSFSLGVKRSGNGKVTYKSSNTKIAKVSTTGRVYITGTGKVTITAYAASTSTYNKATKTITVYVSPKREAIRGLTSYTGSFWVKWNKDTRASGYQVMYAKNSSFTKSRRTLTLGSYKYYSKKVTGLSKKTGYYVKVRAYKKVTGKVLYGSWSSIKKVRTR